MRTARFQVQGRTASELDAAAVRVMMGFLDIGDRSEVEQFQYGIDARPLQMAHGDEAPVLWDADVEVRW
jgi:hypothetical protein